MTTLTQPAGFLEGTLCCLMGASATPAPLVSLYPVCELFATQLDDLLTLTQVMGTVIAKGAVGLLPSFVWSGT